MNEQIKKDIANDIQKILDSFWMRQNHDKGFIETFYTENSLDLPASRLFRILRKLDEIE